MTAEEEIKQATKILTDYLKQKHLRRTQERFGLLELVYGQPSHFSADTLVELATRKFRVSRATVYNTLELLVACRLVVKHQFDSQHTEYEKITSSTTHHHRICIGCGAVSEFSDQKIRRAIQYRTFSAFVPTHYTLYLYGYCKTCAKKLKRDTKAWHNN